MARNFTGLEIVMKVKPFCGDGRGDGMVMAMYMLERVVQVAPQPLVVVSVKRKERRGKRERESNGKDTC